MSACKEPRGYKFQFLHQMSPDVNQFKDPGDQDIAEEKDVFYELDDAPKPRSSQFKAKYPQNE